MKNSQNDSAQALKPTSKGIRMPLNGDLVTFMYETMSALDKEWDKAENVREFWDAVDGLGFTKKVDGDDEKYGERKFVDFPVRNNTFRISLICKAGVVSLDLREWWL